MNIKRELVRTNSEILCSCGKPAIVRWVVSAIMNGKIVNCKELHSPKVLNFCTACHKKEVDSMNSLYPHYLSKKMTYNVEEEGLPKEKDKDLLATTGGLIELLKEYPPDTPLYSIFDSEVIQVKEVKEEDHERRCKEYTLKGRRVVLECDTVRSRWPEETPYT